MVFFLSVAIFGGICWLFNRLIRKTCVNQVSKANDTNNTRKNRPVSKYHNSFLHQDLSIIPPKWLKFQWNLPKRSAKKGLITTLSSQEAGFSLLEITVVTGLLGTMAYLGMGLMENIRSGQKDIMKKFEVQSIHEEVTQILKISRNCSETFKDLEIQKELFKNYKQLGATSSIIKVISKPEDDDIFLAKYSDSKIKENIYNGVKIESFDLAWNEGEGYLEEENNVAEVNLLITYSFKRLTGEKDTLISKAIPISLEFKENDKKELVNCNTYGGNQATGPITVIDPLMKSQFVGVTGDEACEKIGKSCSFVRSQNYATNAYGANMLVSLCETNYNTDTNEFKKGSPVSDHHSCEAKLGVFDTYIINKKTFGITCKGIFMAYCQ